MKSSNMANKWWYLFNSRERATHNKIINILHWGRIHQSNKCCVVGVKDADWKHFSSQFSLTLHYDINSYLNPWKILEALHCSPRSGELRTQKLKSHLVRTQSLKVLPFKPGVGQYSHTCYAYCQGFLPCIFLHFRSIYLHFFQNLSRFFPVLAVANTLFLCRPAK